MPTSTRNAPQLNADGGTSAKSKTNIKSKAHVAIALPTSKSAVKAAAGATSSPTATTSTTGSTPSSKTAKVDSGSAKAKGNDESNNGTKSSTGPNGKKVTEKPTPNNDKTDVTMTDDMGKDINTKDVVMKNSDATGTGPRSSSGAPSVTTMRTTLSARQATGTQTAAAAAAAKKNAGGGGGGGDTSKKVSKASTSSATGTAVKTALGIGTPKAISKETPKAGATVAKLGAVASKGNGNGNPNAALEAAQSNVERSLRQQLAASEKLMQALQKENEEVTQALEQERNRLTDLAHQVRSEATYSHQVSRLVRVFRELDVNLPPLDLEEWNARRVADQVRDVIGDNIRSMRESMHFNSSLECLRLILGATEVIPSSRPNTFKFVLRNEELKREMSFWLSWTESTFTYTKINIDIPEKDAPEFLSETSIDFDVRQGPNFLLQVLGCVFHQSSDR